MVQITEQEATAAAVVMQKLDEWVEAKTDPDLDQSPAILPIDFELVRAFEAYVKAVGPIGRDRRLLKVT